MGSMKAQPLFDNILVKQLEKKKATKGGIIMPDDKNMQDIIEGEVIAVGTGKYLPVALKLLGMEQLALQPMVVQVGQHIVFKQFVATPIKVDGEKLLLINQNDVQAIINYE